MKELRVSVEEMCSLYPAFFDIFSFPVREYAHLYEAKKGEYILREGKKSDTIYYMFKGRNKVRTQLSNGKATIIDFQTPPCFIGEMELFGVLDEPFEVRAMSDSLLFGVLKYDCAPLMLSDSKFLRYMCTYIGKNEIRKITALANQRGYTLSHRLADFMLQASLDDNFTESATNTAEYLGVSYRHLQDVLTAFVNKGYIEKTVNGYRIKNEDKLAYLASEIQK